MADAACDVCDISKCATVPGSFMLLKKLDSMISDNCTIIIVMFVVLTILGFTLAYFVQSITRTLMTYLTNKWEKDKELKAANGKNNPRSVADDDYRYYGSPSEDPEYTDPTKYLPQTSFVQEVDTVFDKYNKDKRSYIAAQFEGRQNDDVIDKTILYKEYDDYTY